MNRQTYIPGMLGAALAVLALTGPAGAQDWTLNPTYGASSLQNGFRPDPHVIDLHSGGEINAARMIGGHCTGFIANAPDYRLTYEAGDLPLIFEVTANVDTTLVINGPDGLWYCDDDSAGNLNPRLYWTSPPSGQYDIFVGTYGNAGIRPAQLSITEIPPEVAEPPVPDWSLDPTFGTVSLDYGFLPDPFEIQLQSGGAIDAAAAIGAPCVGFVAQAPDFRFTYNAGSPPLIISVGSEADTTLVINGPDGLWYCDDDSGEGLNPSLRWDTPPSGQYDIYVGTYGEAALQDATLWISEITSH
ncbi:hypothetical protein [Hyphobacterium marinum]|uniref:Peptidase C-terminal archaeal/bacterial domain-containing protein n=1 Tax=Hyphobacterium marinum TaxID=3116574 RepID=A0ABU7LV76_9PROT|nr:hypothetical protein [Hyphobacterium sp. Y6023]MEE2565157.1 hypothetical protein [Hyphobacterium sp. Y6023]